MYDISLIVCDYVSYYSYFVYKVTPLFYTVQLQKLKYTLKKVQGRREVHDFTKPCKTNKKEYLSQPHNKISDSVPTLNKRKTIYLFLTQIPTHFHNFLLHFSFRILLNTSIQIYNSPHYENLIYIWSLLKQFYLTSCCELVIPHKHATAWEKGSGFKKAHKQKGTIKQ